MLDSTTEKMKQVWSDALEDIREKVGTSDYESWFSKLHLIGISNDEARIAAPTKYIRDNVTWRYSDVIVNAISAGGCQISCVNIDVYDNNNSEKVAESAEPTKKQPEQKSAFNLEGMTVLDKKFTFKNFIVGKPNEFAYAAAMRVAEAETPAFNPLFLYGGVGLGKTHLMHAIAWHIKETQPQKRFIYLSAEKFMYLFIKSLRYKDAMSFKELFRNVDVLMVDDVQFIGGKDTTQEEFFHTFNELVNNNRQIILSADKSPTDLDGMEDRLKSRLGWGLVADIHPTSYELRLGILQSKARRHKIKIPGEVLEFLSMKITSNIRELEGALNRVVAHAMLVGGNITIDMAGDVLRDLLRSNEKYITMDLIQRKVCEFFNIKLTDLTSAKRQKAIAKARHIAMYLAKELTTKSLPDIGRSFGGKDHSTVIHAVKKVKENVEKDKEFATNLEILRKSIEN